MGFITTFLRQQQPTIDGLRTPPDPLDLSHRGNTSEQPPKGTEMTNDRKKDLFSADIPLASELTEAGINQTAGGNFIASFSRLIGNKGRICTVTKECRFLCR